MKNTKQKISLKRVLEVAADVRSFGLPHDLENDISLRDAVDVLQKGCNLHPELLTLAACLEIARDAYVKERNIELEDDRGPRVPLQDEVEHQVNKLHQNFSPGHAW